MQGTVRSVSEQSRRRRVFAAVAVVLLASFAIWAPEFMPLLLAAMVLLGSVALYTAKQRRRDLIGPAGAARRHAEMVDRTRMFAWEVHAKTGEILSIAGNVQGVLGYEPEELIGRNVSLLANAGEIRRARLDFDRRPGGEETWVVPALHKSGRQVMIREVRHNDAGSSSIQGVAIDITELVRATDQLQWQATHDALTGLANRELLETRAAELLAEGTAVAVLVADLNRFKEINDTLGHPTGDLVLRTLAARFAESLADLELVARIGGDEFAFLIRVGDQSLDDVYDIGLRVQRLATSVIAVDTLQLAVACSVGVAMSPDDGESYEELLKHADIATYEAKRTGGGVCLFESAPDQLSIRRLQLISDIPNALRCGEFRLHYQPQIDLASGEIMGVEGLARWAHPEFGLLLPGDFLDVLEVAADYRRFTGEVVRMAVAFVAEARDAGHRLPVSINLASMSFLDRTMPSVVEGLLRMYGVDGNMLTLEVTESDLLDEQSSGPVIDALKALGCKLSIDDFGTGYSSLTRLRALDIDEVKIDRSFVAGLGENAEDEIIVRTVIELATLLGQAVVAEGVETPGQRELLQRLGCRSAQGWLFARAEPSADVLQAVTSGFRFDVGPGLVAGHLQSPLNELSQADSSRL